MISLNMCYHADGHKGSENKKKKKKKKKKCPFRTPNNILKYFRRSTSQKTVTLENEELDSATEAD
jgi:hypothetical protein